MPAGYWLRNKFPMPNRQKTLIIVFCCCCACQIGGFHQRNEISLPSYTRSEKLHEMPLRQNKTAWDNYLLENPISHKLVDKNVLRTIMEDFVCCIWSHLRDIKTPGKSMLHLGPSERHQDSSQMREKECTGITLIK